MKKFCVFCKINLMPEAMVCPACHSPGGILSTEQPNTPPVPIPVASRAAPVVAGYTLFEKLGAGGMGTVYLGEKPNGRRAAIKLLHEKYTQNFDLVGRFLREAKAVSVLKHLNIVEMYDYGLDANWGYFLVLEHLEGESLFRRLTRVGAFSPFHAAQIILRALNGLGAAHERGIVHRDLKPANLFLRHGEPPQVKLLDFGVAKLHSDAGITITQTGAVLGTPEYMSPEQAFGKREVDGRADLYSVGVILFELITGRRPFLAPSPGLLLVKHKQEPPPLPSQFAPGLPREMDELILACLEKEPRNRPSSTEDVANALRKMRLFLPDAPLSSLVASSSGDTVTMDIEVPDSNL